MLLQPFEDQQAAIDMYIYDHVIALASLKMMQCKHMLHVNRLIQMQPVKLPTHSAMHMQML